MVRLSPLVRAPLLKMQRADMHYYAMSRNEGAWIGTFAFYAAEDIVQAKLFFAQNPETSLTHVAVNVGGQMLRGVLMACDAAKAKYEEGMSAGKTSMHVAVSGDNSAETVMRIGHVSKGDEVTVEFAFSFLCGVGAMSDTKRCIAISDAWTTFAFHAVNMQCNSVVIDDEPLLRGDGSSRNTWTARPRTMEDAAWSKGRQSSLAFETCETLTRPVVLCQPLATGGHTLCLCTALCYPCL